MRTIVVGRGAETNGSVQVHVAGPLELLGHVVVGFDPTLHGPEPLDALGDLMSSADVELCVVVPTPGDLDLGELRAVSAEYEVLTLALHLGLAAPDAPTCLTDLERHYLDVDLVSVPDRWTEAVLAPLARHGLTCWAPAVNIDALDGADHDAAVPARQLVVLGDADPLNADLVRDLVEAELDLVLVGRGWEKVPDLRVLALGEASLGERVATMSAAELAVELPPTVELCSQARTPAEEAPLSLAALEAMALGTPLVAMERPALSAATNPSEHLLVCPDPSSLADLCRLVLSTPDVLRQLALAGQQQVRSEHQAVGRWVSLLDRFSPTRLPSRPARPRQEPGLVSVVLLDEGQQDPGPTLDDILGQSVPVEVVLVGRAPRPISDPRVASVAVAGTGRRSAVVTGLALSRGEMVAVADAGDRWTSDRLARQLERLRLDPALDAVHAPGDGGPVTYNRWSLARVAAHEQPVEAGTVLMRHRSVVEQGAIGLLAGDESTRLRDLRRVRLACLADPVTTRLARRPGLPRVEMGATWMWPELVRSDSAGVAAAFCDLAAHLIDQQPDTARELVATALDHLAYGDERLSAIAAGAQTDAVELARLAHHYGASLRRVVPAVHDQVWTHTGELVRRRRLVIDTDWHSAGGASQVLVEFLRAFDAGEPVELVLARRSADAELVLDRVSEVLVSAGVDPTGAADLILADEPVVERGDLYLRFPSEHGNEAALESARDWIAEVRAERDHSLLL